jgi:3-hydroxybutyryl-CoA dehydrogenase
VTRAGVLGGGQMGLGIALVIASVAKTPVTLVDASEVALSKGQSFMEKLLQKDIGKGKITEEAAAETRQRVKFSTDVEQGFKDVDFLVEAIPEIPSLKFEVFKRLAESLPKHAILATNTSSISITKIAHAAKGAEDRVIGFHLMNPVPVMKGIEVITGLQTSNDTLETALAFGAKMGKLASRSVDSPGFLANRLLMPYLNEAIIALETGVGKAEDIDNIMKNGCSMPMGPLALADFIGLDTCLSIMRVLYGETGDSKYRPAILLGKMVDAGWLGKKSGKGFYNY